jgi:hypothetical protein
VTPGAPSPGPLTGLGSGGGVPGTGQVTWDTSGSGEVQYDLFDRADTTGALGVATNGQTWSQTGTGLKVSGKRGAAADSGDQGLLEISTADQDFKMDFSGQNGHFNIFFQANDSDNFFAVQHWPTDGHTTLGVMVAHVWTLYDEKDIQAKSSATWQVTYTSGSNGIQVHRDGEAVFSYILDVVAYAKTLLGKPYDANQWVEAPGTTGVGIGPASYTCCGLTAVAYGRLGVDLPPYNVVDQYNAATAVTGTPQAGDLVFFHWNVAGNPDAWNHVGLLSDSSGALINADSDKMTVRTTTVSDTLAKQPGSDVAYRRVNVGYSVSPNRTKAGFAIGSDGGAINVTVDNFVSAAASGGIDNYRITPDNGAPFAVTPAQIGASGFPNIPLTPGACNSVTVQAHNAAGWSAPSLPSACTTNQGAQGVYDSFVRADATGGFGTASNGTGWTAHYAGGIKENAGYSYDSLGWEMLDIGSRDQDWVMDVHGSDVATANGVLWLYFSGKAGSYDYLRLTCSPGGYVQQSSLDQGIGGTGIAAQAWFPNYTLDRYDQYHVQSYDVGAGKFRVCVSRGGTILLNELIDAPGDATWTYAGVGLPGGPYPWGDNHARAAAFMQANPKRVRGPRATPGVGQASFTCEAPAGVAHPTQYRVKVDGRTVTAASLPIVVDALTDFAEYTFTMSAKGPDGTWGFDSDQARVKPGWALKPTITSATRSGFNVVVAYTLGAANSVNIATDHLHAVDSNVATWDIAPPHAGTLTLTGCYGSRVKLWMSGDWADNPCDTISDWHAVV